MKTKNLRIFTAKTLIHAIARGETTWDRQNIDWTLKQGKQRKRAHCVNSGVPAARRAKAKRKNRRK